MMKFVRFSFLMSIIFFALISCLDNKNTEKKEPKGKVVKDGLVETFFSNGNKRVAIIYKNGKKNGIAKEFYESGQLFQEIEYKDNVKVGTSKRYHKNGELYQSTTYANGKMQGMQKKFREDGTPSSVAIYFQDEPCKGLVEYTLKGVEKKKYPTLVITPIDNLLINDRYILRLSLSDGSKNVEFYSGHLDKQGCFTNALKEVWGTRSPGIVNVEYDLPPGAFLMEKVNFIAKVKTLQGNYYITEKSFNLAIENR